MSKATQERQGSCADRLRLEILAGMQTFRDSDRRLLSADDATDRNLSSNEDEDDRDAPFIVLSGVGLQIKTAGLRQGKCVKVPAPISLAGVALNGRTAQLMRRIVGLLSLGEVIERDRAQGAWNYCVYAAASRDKNAIGYTIKVYRNAEPEQLKAWAQDESELYERILKCGVNIPELALCLEHIVVTHNVISTSPPYYKPVPCLVHSLPPAWGHLGQEHEREYCYMKVLWTVRKLYQRVGIVHGNLSEHTVLYEYKRCWLTDLSRVMNRNQQGHKQVLAQDLARTNAFFATKGLSTSASKEGIGLLPDEVALAYVTTEDLGSGLDVYVVRQTYDGESKEFIPFLFHKKRL